LFLSLAEHADLVWGKLREGADGAACELAPDHQMAIFDGKAYLFLEGGEDMLLKHFND
jgi:hypothetical protein